MDYGSKLSKSISIIDNFQNKQNQEISSLSRGSKLNTVSKTNVEFSGNKIRHKNPDRERGECLEKLGSNSLKNHNRFFRVKGKTIITQRTSLGKERFTDCRVQLPFNRKKREEPEFSGVWDVEKKQYFYKKNVPKIDTTDWKFFKPQGKEMFDGTKTQTLNTKGKEVKYGKRYLAFPTLGTNIKDVFHYPSRCKGYKSPTVPDNNIKSPSSSLLAAPASKYRFSATEAITQKTSRRESTNEKELNEIIQKVSVSKDLKILTQKNSYGVFDPVPPNVIQALRKKIQKKREKIMQKDKEEAEKKRMKLSWYETDNFKDCDMSITDLKYFIGDSNADTSSPVYHILTQSKSDKSILPQKKLPKSTISGNIGKASLAKKVKQKTEPVTLDNGEKATDKNQMLNRRSSLVVELLHLFKDNNMEKLVRLFKKSERKPDSNIYTAENSFQKRVDVITSFLNLGTHMDMLPLLDHCIPYRHRRPMIKRRLAYLDSKNYREHKSLMVNIYSDIILLLDENYSEENLSCSYLDKDPYAITFDFGGKEAKNKKVRLEDLYQTAPERNRYLQLTKQEICINKEKAKPIDDKFIFSEAEQKGLIDNVQDFCDWVEGIGGLTNNPELDYILSIFFAKAKTKSKRHAIVEWADLKSLPPELIDQARVPPPECFLSSNEKRRPLKGQHADLKGHGYGSHYYVHPSKWHEVWHMIHKELGGIKLPSKMEVQILSSLDKFKDLDIRRIMTIWCLYFHGKKPHCIQAVHSVEKADTGRRFGTSELFKRSSKDQSKSTLASGPSKTGLGDKMDKTAKDRLVKKVKALRSGLYNQTD